MKKVMSACLIMIGLMQGVGAAKIELPVLSDVQAIGRIEIVMPQDCDDWKEKMETLVNHAKPGQDTPLGRFADEWRRNQRQDLGSWFLALDTVEPLPVETPLLLPAVPQAQGNVHIFIDYSNIAAGFQTGNSHPINPEGLAAFLENHRIKGEAQISASFPPADHDVWKDWNKLGYRTRVASSGKELFVDDSLHAQIFRLLLRKAQVGTIVLVTGDGNSNDNYSSFIECAMRAVEHGWKVEVCSWKQRLNKRYKDIAKQFQNNIEIRYLDESKHTILNLG